MKTPAKIPGEVCRFAMALDGEHDLASRDRVGALVTFHFDDAIELRAKFMRREVIGKQAWYLCGAPLLGPGEVLNGPDHPVPVLAFWCSAPDADTYGSGTPTSSILKDGKRAGRLHHIGGAYEAFDPPQEIEPGSIVLRPQAYSFDPQPIGKVTL